jgi:hypothetical protein
LRQVLPEAVDRYLELFEVGSLAPGRIRGIADQVADFSDPGQPHLCCLPDLTQTYGRRWMTLATVLLDPGVRRLQVLDGPPTDIRRVPWIELSAA